MTKILQTADAASVAAALHELTHEGGGSVFVPLSGNSAVFDDLVEQGAASSFRVWGEIFAAAPAWVKP